MDYLAKLARGELVPRSEGLGRGRRDHRHPVTIDLRNEIMLKSALNLILEPLHLSYVIKDEVLKITSEQMQRRPGLHATYNVADLVIPIPNFVPGPMGLRRGLSTTRMDAVGFGGGAAGFGPDQLADGGGGQTPTASAGSGMINPSVLAQMAASPQLGRRRRHADRAPAVGAGPGGLGGGSQADFDSLIDLITTTIKPTTWDDVGGPGSIRRSRPT